MKTFDHLKFKAMKKILVCLFLAAISTCAIGQLQPRMDETTTLWGYVNEQNQWVIQPTYKTADSFMDGLARVSNTNSFYGVINERNEVVVPLVNAYVGLFSEGMAHAQDGTSFLYGYYGRTGNLIVPFQYEMANSFSSGLAAVRQNNKWGFIDNTGKIVITPQFDGSDYNAEDDWLGDYGFDFDLGYNFSDGYCIVKKNGLKGLIDKRGAVVIDFKYGSLSLNSDGKTLIASVCDAGNSNCRFGIIQMNGSTLIPFEYSGIEFDDGYFKLYQGSTPSLFLGSPMGGVMGFADSNGKIIVPCMYDNDGDHTFENIGYAFTNQRYKGGGVYDGMILLRRNNLWGYLDLTGKEAIPFQFEEATAFAKDSAEVKLNGHTFMINKQGRCIQNCPEDLSLMTPEKLADQSGNYDYLLNTFMKFYWEDSDTYAGEELTKRQKSLYEENKQRLDLLIAHGDTKQKAWAKHVKFSMVREISVEESKKSCSLAMNYLRLIRPLASQIDRYDYPIRFFYKTEEYEYRYEDFDVMYWKYYTTLAECEYLTKDPMAIEDLKIAISHETNDFNKTLFYAYLIDFKQSVNQYDVEMLSYSNLMLEKFVALNEEQRTKLNSKNLWTGNQPAAIEAAYTSKTSERISNDFYVKAYPLYQQLGDADNANYFMEKLFKNGYDDFYFLWSMAEKKRNDNDFDEAARIADKLAIKTSITDCAGLQRLAEFYMSINRNAEAKEMKSKADDCFKSEQKQAEKNEREANRRSKRSYSSYSVNPGVYFGVDLFPLMSTVKGHRDFGVCMNIVGRQAAHEFYYEKINENKDQLFDVANAGKDTDGYDVRWSGYQAAYAIKGYLNDDRNVQYFGVNLRYRNKTFSPVTSYIMDINNSILSPEKTYKPTEQQIELLLNWGYMTTRRGIACDMYFGFGPKYSIFSNNIENYNADDVYSHVMLENRKETRWGLGLRIGLTIGFKL